jgi:hypothetical protein
MRRNLDETNSKAAEVIESGTLLVVRFKKIDSLAFANLICNALVGKDHPGVHEDSLYQFYVRLGHESYALG